MRFLMTPSSPVDSYNAYAGFDTAEKDKNQNLLFSLTHLWTNNFISSTKISLNRLNDFQGSAPPERRRVY